MTRAVRIRLLAFVVLSAVGVVYVAAAYLGLVDRVLGRGYTVHVDLPTSGGLFEGSEVTYRGTKIGKVSAMDTTRTGVALELSIEEGVQIPLDSPMYVHNLSAVGEQYLDFEPPDAKPPYAEDGSRMKGSAASLPVDEADLLVSLDRFVNSVDQRSLKVLIRELGDMFVDTGRPLQQLIDDGGAFIDDAAAHTDETVQLLESARTVLRTQRHSGDNITSFSRDLADLTDALRRSDGDIRTVLDDTPPAAREVRALLRDLGPTLPVLLSDLVTVNQVVVSHLDGVEQLLVTFPRVIAGGFTGSPPDGYGHVNLQFDYSVPPCVEGYKPSADWRRGDELGDAPIYPAQCKSGAPFVQRGTPHVPGTPGNPGNNSSAKQYADGAVSGTYDPSTGLVDGVVDEHGDPVRFGAAGDLSILGDDSWKWLLVGPLASPTGTGTSTGTSTEVGR
ncbi:MCE family protein [Nocardioides plantarum]|uniref:MCE family protein n=1 Tax=Nocardioides plantarum TaxID=29299 RepID=A0ABV5K5D4_9ACTN|nr:MlaD family protein [Nocardioides plantarum]